MPLQPSLDTAFITPPSESENALSADPPIIRPSSRASTAPSSPIDAYVSAASASEAEGDEDMETPTQSQTQDEPEAQVQPAERGHPESIMRHKSTGSTATLTLGSSSSPSSSTFSGSRTGKEARVVSPSPESVASTSSSTTISRRMSRRRSKASFALSSGSNPEQGWDDYTEANGNVMDFKTETEVQRRLTYTEKVISQEMGSAVQGNWSFTKVFVDGSFMASGYLYIPKGGKKESKSVRDNTYIFHVLEGAVNVRIHMSSYILASGATFMVPRGNVYYIENISDRPAKLMFVQAREITVNETDDPLRLVRGQHQRHLAAVRTSKLFILLGWIFELMMKRFVKYRRLLWVWYLRTSMLIGSRVKGPRAYAAFFVLGILVRSLGPSRSLLPRFNLQIIRD